MNSRCHDQKLCPVIGIITFSLLIIYLNFSEDFESFRFPLMVRNLPKMGFVGVNHTRFVVLNDDRAAMKEVYVNGWNSYWLMEESASGDHASRGRVSEMLRRGAEMGLTVCRTWAFNDGPRPNGLQVLPGVFNERVFQALDYVLLEARRNKVRLILSFVNNLNAYGGKAQYVRWAEEARVVTNASASGDLFFSNPIIKGYYRDYVRAIVTRKNSYTGVKYRDDPSIFAWELINEPRCESVSCGSDLQAWITEMAAYVKTLDGKHLVTVGVEGFYSSTSAEGSSSYGSANPGLWAASLGSDFINNSAVKGIDFASVHAYPHSWIPHADLEEKNKYLSGWADKHIRDGEDSLKKPVLFTEMGAPMSIKAGHGLLHDRDVMMKTIYDKIYESAKKRGAGAGVLIWQLLVEGVEKYRDEFSFIAWAHPSTYKLILEQSRRLCSVGLDSRNRTSPGSNDPCYLVEKHV